MSTTQHTAARTLPPGIAWLAHMSAWAADCAIESLERREALTRIDTEIAKVSNLVATGGALGATCAELLPILVERREALAGVPCA